MKEYLAMASVDYTLSQFSYAKMICIIDANAGFWQVSLDPDSTKLATFITPYGRFKLGVYPLELNQLHKCFKKELVKQFTKVLVASWMSL